MSAHIDRMIKEAAELDERIEKLCEFTHGPIFASLDMRKQDAMQNQLKAMELYRHFLGERIMLEQGRSSFRVHGNPGESALYMFPDLQDGERS